MNAAEEHGSERFAWLISRRWWPSGGWARLLAMGMLGVFLVVSLVACWNRWGTVATGGTEYRFQAKSIELTPQPAWIRCDVKEEVMVGSGNLPKFSDLLYRDIEEDLWLIPTSEVALNSLHFGEIIPEEFPLLKQRVTLKFKNLENTPSIPPGRPISETSDLNTTPGGNNLRLKLVPRLATPPPTLIIAL